MTKIFVYGTLRKGFGNHRIVSEGNNKFLRKDETSNSYLMLDTGGFPAVIKEIKHSTIKGELYDVDNETFNSVDKLEGNGMLFQREIVSLNSGNEAWMYFYLSENFIRNFLLENLINDGDYNNYEENRNLYDDFNDELLDELTDYLSPEELHTVISVIHMMDEDDIENLRNLNDAEKELLKDIKELDI